MSLYGALLTGIYSKARRLIQRCAGINTPGYDGETPLMLSPRHPDMNDMSRLLLLAGADVNACNKYGETALMMSLCTSKNNNLEKISLLIENGADASLVSVYGYMARDFALYASVFDRFFPENTERRAIRKKVAIADAASIEDICLEQPIDHVLLRFMLEDAICSQDVKRVEAFLKLGVPADSPTRWGSTGLFDAACRANIELVKLLLRYGANPTCRDRYGMTALMEMKTCVPGLHVCVRGFIVSEFIDKDHALEQLGKERMEEIAAVQREIEQLLVEPWKQ